MNISITTPSQVISFHISNKIKLLFSLVLCSLLAFIIYCMSVAIYWEQKADKLFAHKNILLSEKRSLINLNAKLLSQASSNDFADGNTDHMTQVNYLQSSLGNSFFSKIFSNQVD